MVPRKFFLVFLFFLLALNFQAFGFYSNYNSIIMGDLAAGLGGSGTGLLGDVSSSGFYNPASLAFLTGSSFSAAVGIYKKFDTEYGEQSDFSKAALRVNLGFFRSLPASTGSVITWRGFKMGMTIAVPYYDNYRGDLTTTEEQTTTISYTDESLWVGGAISKKVTEDISLGLTLYYTAENQVYSVNDRTTPTVATSRFFNSERTLTSNSIVPILGYYHIVTPKLSGGISLRLRGAPLGATGAYFSNYADVADPNNNEKVTFTEQKGDVPVPGKLSFGYSYWITPRLLWVGSLDLYEAFSYEDFENPLIARHVEHRFTTNGAMGFEWAYKRWLRFRIGGFTNFSSHPDPDLNLGRLQPDKVDQLGFSANVVLIAQKNISYTFGGYYSGGKGQSIQRIGQNFQIVPVSKQVFTMLVGTAFSL